MTRPVDDPVGLEVRWDRLAAATDEAASTMLRTAFSTIIRESNDYTVVLMDRAGRTMAESRAGIPAFAALMSSLTALVLDRFPADEWREGDSVITNDPWTATGHLPDIAMISPVFHHGRLVAFAGTVAHSPDIGGTPTLGATELISEGILIPPLRLFRAGRVEQGVKDLLLANVRLADQVWGDLEAQAAAHAVCRRRAQEFLTDFGEPDFEAFAEQVHAVTDAAMRACVRDLPDGVHRAALDADGVEGHLTHIECAVTVRGDEIEIDYTGSSPQVPFATNSTLNYTRAYSMYPLKILLDPSTRTNWGSYRSIRVTAPEGTIVNPTSCSSPTPAWARPRSRTGCPPPPSRPTPAAAASRRWRPRRPCTSSARSCGRDRADAAAAAADSARTSRSATPHAGRCRWCCSATASGTPRWDWQAANPAPPPRSSSTPANASP